MNIRLDQAGNTTSVDENINPYSTYSKNSIRANFEEKQTRATTAAGAFNVQLGGVLSDTGLNAYNEKKGETDSLTEKMQSKKKDYMMVMSSVVSDKELSKLGEGGINTNEMDPEEIVTVVDRIKAVMAESGVIVEGYNDDVSGAALEEVTGSRVAAENLKKIAEGSNEESDNSENIRRLLNSFGISDVVSNVEAVNKVLSINEKLSPVSEGSIRYLIENNLPPTFENLYMAEHSGAVSGKGATGYFDNGGFFSKKGDSSSYEELMPQIENIISESGYEVSEESKNDALWLLDNGIELTKESFDNLAFIKNLQVPVKEEDAIKAAVVAIKNGKTVTQAIPGDLKSNEEKALEKIDELNEVIAREDEKTSGDFTKTEEYKHVGEPLDNQSFADLSYRRQLEETRFVMTVSNASFLIKNDIKIDFTNLEKLVENLKAAEDAQNEILYKRGNAIDNRAANDIFNYTNKIVNEAPTLPVSALSLALREDINLDSFYREGTALKQNFEIAGKNYEALMTEVRADLGDSIDKAFRNIKELLLENGIEVTEENEKAARILGYNEMAITTENVDRIREADLKLERVIRKLTPSVTLSLVRDGINPVNMNLDELEARLNERRQESPSDEIEKYSNFLARLDSTGEISEDERAGYIGIYRMLYQIEKRDGAALGALLSQGGEMTLGNLLTQVRNANAKGRSYEINDSFGVLEQVVNKDESITDQLERAFSKQNIIKQNETSELKNEDIDDIARRQIEKQNVANRKTEIIDAATSGEETLQLLNIGELPAQIANINGAKALLYDRPILLRASRNAAKTDNITGENSEDTILSENFERLEKSLLEFTDKLSDEITAKAAYEEIANQMEDIMKDSVFTVNDRHVAKDIRLAMGALNIAKGLARNEHYEIPMEIGGEESSVSVHLLRDNSKNPSVNIYSETGSYGRINANFIQGEAGLEGIIMSDRPASMDMLRSRLSGLANELAEKGISITSISFMENKNTGLKSSLSKVESVNEEVQAKDRMSGRELYETAKAFLKKLV